MRILYVADILPYPPNTGIKIRTYNIIKELANEGRNQVDLVCFSHKVLTPSQDEIDRNAYELRKICNEVHVFSIPGDSNSFTRLLGMAKNLVEIQPYRVSRYWSGDCVRMVEELAAVNAYDVIHLDKAELYRYSELVKGVPVICTNHNVESWLMKRRAKYETSFLRKAFAYLQYVKTERFERVALTRSAGYITCTDVDQKYFEKNLGIETKHRTIDNGVDTEFYQPSDIYGGDFLLIIGAQSREATANFDGTHYFMREVWPLIKEREPGIKLKFVGRNPDQSVLEYENDSGVEVVGFVEDERSYLGSACMLIVPLRLGGGSRLKILTAMAMSRPIVSTTIGAEGIDCECGRDIILADDPRGFANEVIELYRDVQRQREIGRAGRVTVEDKYNWSRIGQNVRLFFEEVVANNEASRKHALTTSITGRGVTGEE